MVPGVSPGLKPRPPSGLRTSGAEAPASTQKGQDLGRFWPFAFSPLGYRRRVVER